MAAQVSTGATIEFGTSGFTAEIVDFTPPPASREALDTSHQGTKTAKTFTPAKLVDWGELTFQIHADPATDPPINSSPEDITITFAEDNDTWQFSGFITGYELSGTLEELITGTVTVKVTGDVTISAGSGSGSGA